MNGWDRATRLSTGWTLLARTDYPPPERRAVVRLIVEYAADGSLVMVEVPPGHDAVTDALERGLT